MTPRRNAPTSSPFTRMVNALLLLGWLLSSNGMAPAFTLLAANLDRCHQVKVANTSAGELRVVLSHEGNDASQGLHVHSHLTTLMLVFAQAAPSQKSDHILAFQSIEDLGRSLERDALSMPAPIPTTALHDLRVNLPAVTMRIRIVRSGHAPVWSPGVALKAGKTLLQC